jgi:hypothetical protein
MKKGGQIDDFRFAKSVFFSNLPLLGPIYPKKLSHIANGNFLTPPKEFSKIGATKFQL